MKIVPAIFFLAVALVSAAPASAQLLDDDDVISVKDRMEPDWLPLGVPVGAFILNPGISVAETWDDNIYRQAGDEKSDLITEVRPGVNLRSNWNLHAVEAKAVGDFGLYADNTSENYQDYTLSLAGRYDITYETHLDAAVLQESLHEDRSSPDDVGGDEPTEFNRKSAKIGFTRALGKVKFRMTGFYQDYEFEDSERNGLVIDNGTRDRNQTRVEGRVGYEFIPSYEVFVSAARDVRDYDQPPASDRSSTGYDVRAGTALNISGKVKGEIYGGYMEQDFEGPFSDIGDANYGGSLLWNITGITSLHASLDRSVYDSSVGDASGILRTVSAIGAEHALRRNILLEAQFGMIQDEFTGGTDGREDETYRAGMGISYKPFRGAVAEARYHYNDRDSSLDTADFTNNQLMLRFSYAF